MTGEDRFVLCGFMGTGKTTVGRELAARLGGRFVDLDDLIEQRFGMSVTRIFELHGEEAFRKAEREACSRVGAWGADVVAVGGGAVLDPDCRRTLESFGLLVCLTASLEALEQRLAKQSHRPLLRGTKPLSSVIRELLEERRVHYEAVAWQVDTTGRTPAQTCDAILRSSATALRGKKIARLAVNMAEVDYDVCVGPGLLSELGALLAAAPGPAGPTVALVTNPVVRALYGRDAERSLRASGFDVFTCDIPNGERSKTLPTVSGLYARFVELGLDRQGTVVALGGGVTGDVAGFAAATYLRGVRLVQVPTTLLAMVDAAVGGKTGVDLPEGKNLVGAFKHPACVVADPSVLATLPREEIAGGMAEVIKHALIGDPLLLSRIEGGDWTIGRSLLCAAIRVKVDVVNEDPFEMGRRAVLNLGHTFAHAFERASGYGLRHGMAVGLGLRAAARLGRVLGIGEEGLEDRILRLLEMCGLPTRLDGLSVMEARGAMATDKKRKGGRLRFVVPRRPGDVVVVDSVEERAIDEALGAVLR